MFNFLFSHKTQHQRILELLQKKGTVSSLEISQMHPVILNFHDKIMKLRERYNIETHIEKVKGIKHTSYIYHGELTCPMPHQKVKKYTQEEMDAEYERGYKSAVAQLGK